MPIDSQPAVLVKKYAQERLYRPDIMTYLTRKHLMAMAARGKRFVVIDAETGDDVTASSQTIMVEQ
jgi:polyhydroxyalkanoate synthesis regulator protein